LLTAAEWPCLTSCCSYPIPILLWSLVLRSPVRSGLRSAPVLLRFHHHCSGLLRSSFPSSFRTLSFPSGCSSRTIIITAVNPPVSHCIRSCVYSYSFRLPWSILLRSSNPTSMVIILYFTL
jgi:hypothetical protein